MAAIDVDVTVTPQDVVTVAGLTAGTPYQVQNVSTTATLFVREAVNAPAAGARGFRVEAGGNATIRPEAGAAVWLWTDDPAGRCPVILDEAA